MSSPVLPFVELEDVDPIGALAHRSRYLSQVVEALSRRSDVRRRRARLLLLLLRHACPVGRPARREWYVPGAVARLGAEGVCRLWREDFGEDPPSVRTVRRYLATFVRLGVVARQPGDHLPGFELREESPRYPDTLHVATSEREARWWRTVGAERLAQHPEAAARSWVWRALFGSWRAESAQLQLVPTPEIADVPEEELREPAIAALETAIAGGADAPTVLALCGRAGARLHGRHLHRLALARESILPAAALLACALRRELGGRARLAIRRRGAWLVWAFDHAPAASRAEAFATVRHRVRARRAPRAGPLRPPRAMEA